MNFGTLFLIVIAGLLGLVPSGFRRFSIPLVMVEICAGIAIGDTGLHMLNPADPILQFFSSVGFAMLMFLIGTKLPLRNKDLRGALKHSFTALALAMGVAVLPAMFLAHVTSLHNMPMFLLLLSCSSTAVVMPMVNEKKLTGRLVLLTTTWVMVADITTVVALPLAMYPDRLPKIILGALVITAVGAACWFGLKFFRQSDSGEYYRQLSKDRGWALDLRLSLAILFALTWLAAQFGTSVLVAGFAAGTIVVLIAHPKRFVKQLTGIAEGFFVPLFFVVFGAKLDFTQLFANWHLFILTGSIVVASITVHLIVAKAMKLPYASGLMAATQQGLPIALVNIGLANKSIEPGQGAAIIAGAMILLATSAMGTNLLSRQVPKAMGQPPEAPPPDRSDEA